MSPYPNNFKKPSHSSPFQGTKIKACSLISGKDKKSKVNHVRILVRQFAMSSSLLNLPNFLTLSRIVAIPLIAICLLAGSDVLRWVAFAAFVLASLTDFLDGYLARLWNQQTPLGRMLDPVADKLLVISTLFLLCALGTIAGWHVLAALIIVIREIFVSGLREFMAGKDIVLHVTSLAKWKTTFQLIALSCLLVGPVSPLLPSLTSLLGLGFLYVVALMTVITGAQYFMMCWKHMKEQS
jgi:cardiolipin synthase